MKVTLENIGVMGKAEFELADLTIICGKNNTGKTYATYALYGFLHHWYGMHNLHATEDGSFFHRPSMYFRYYIPNNQSEGMFFNLEALEQLEKNGKCEIDIKDCLENMQSYIDVVCKEYSEKLSRFFASSGKYFRRNSFSIEIGKREYELITDLEFSMMDDIGFISILKKAGDTKIEISLLDNLIFEKNKKQLGKTAFEGDIIGEVNFKIAERILFPISPKPFITSAERTGVATFRKELNFARNRLLTKMSSIENDSDLVDLYRKNYSDYALPIKENVNFIRALETIAKHDSFIAKEHPQILTYFSEIIGGKYIISENDILHYKPTKRGTRLTMGESSSGVRSLLDIGCYLHYQAEEGDLLIIDEPELNLHPENQRKIARLFARLVNIGVKVFITTHSDYITSELSNLILLNSEDERIIKIAEEKGYKQEELISHEQVKLYTAEPIKANSKKYTLNRAKIDAESGIDAEIFNKTIDEMNEIKEEIFFG